MKKVLLFLLSVILVGCSSVSNLNSYPVTMIVENVVEKKVNGTGKIYIIEAYEYYPMIKCHRFRSRVPYPIGTILEQGGIKVKESKSMDYR